MSEKLKIGITQGDTNGIGWEVILKAFSDARLAELCTPVIYGSQQAAACCAKQLAGVEAPALNVVESAREARRGKVNLVIAGDDAARTEPGTASPAAAKNAMEALEAAAEALAAGDIDALVTAPVNKEAMQAAGFQYTGHTEYLAARLGGEPLMMMCSERLRVGLATIHIPVAEVSASLSQELIVKRLDQLRAALKQDFGIVEPRIAVLSLNPHAGDGGLLGAEEETVIRPAIVEAFGRGVLAFGPFAADGFFASGGYAKYDAVLAMYHDQGLTPFKTLSPDGVNFTAGLSCVRTSPDHGTAYDIAGKNLADPQSLRNAIYAAADIVAHRRAWAQWTRNPLQHAERERGGRDVSVKELPQTETES